MKYINLILIGSILAMSVGCELDDSCTPGIEVCNGVDDDCDGLVDEGGVCCTPYPEVCNGMDDNCNGLIDEGGVCVALTPDGTYTVTTTIETSTCDSVPVGHSHTSTWGVSLSGSTLSLTIDGVGPGTATYNSSTNSAVFSETSSVTDPEFPGYVEIDDQTLSITFILVDATSKGLTGTIDFVGKLYAEGDVGGTVLAECGYHAVLGGTL